MTRYEIVPSFGKNDVFDCCKELKKQNEDYEKLINKLNTTTANTNFTTSII